MASNTSASEDFVLVAGGPVDQTYVSLNIYGEDLIPEAISQLLGCQATHMIYQGDRRTPNSAPYQRSAWLLSQKEKAPITAEPIIQGLLSRVSNDLDLWQELASKYEIQLRISIHMEGWNQGFDLSSEMIQQIAAVGAKIVFDIYAYADDDVEDKA